MELSSTFGPIEPDEVIHDIAYDYYGMRLATCSSLNGQGHIKVWDVSPPRLSAHWEAHGVQIVKAVWAHPEFGQIIASCSPANVIIWEETDRETTGEKLREWQKMIDLVPDLHSYHVSDIKFAPRPLGLRLAICLRSPNGHEGKVRIYEATDIMNLGGWSLAEEFDDQKSGVTCASWNPTPYPRAMIAIGGEEAIKIWQYNETQRSWASVATLSGHTGTIRDVSWAPNLGRSYHLIASASTDKTVKIWKWEMGGTPKGETLTAHQAAVWRVEWNITGTILASSGEDGKIRLWQSVLNEWAPFGVICGK